MPFASVCIARNLCLLLLCIDKALRAGYLEPPPLFAPPPATLGYQSDLFSIDTRRTTNNTVTPRGTGRFALSTDTSPTMTPQLRSNGPTGSAAGSGDSDHNASDDDSTGSSNTVTIKKGTLRKLKEKASYAARNAKSLRNTEKDLEKLKKAYDKLGDQNDKLEQVIQEKLKMIEVFEENHKVSLALLKKAGKVHPCEINKQLAEKVQEKGKTVSFRTWKFLQDANDLDEGTKEVLHLLPATTLTENKLDEENFIRIYRPSVDRGLKLAKQYVQSEGKKRAQGT